MFYFTGGMNWNIAFACCCFCNVKEKKKLVDKISHAKWIDKNNNIAALDSNIKINTYNIILTSKWHLNYSVYVSSVCRCWTKCFHNETLLLFNCILNASVWNSVHFIWIRLKRLYITTVFVFLFPFVSHQFILSFWEIPLRRVIFEYFIHYYYATWLPRCM